MKKLTLILTAAATLAIVNVAQADPIVGGAIGGSGSFTSTSIDFNTLGLVGSMSGALSSVNSESEATFVNGSITGITSAGISLPNLEFVTFSTDDPLATGDGDEFKIDLTSIKSLGGGAFSATGNVVDGATNGFGSTPISLTLSFAGNANTPGLGGSFSFSSTPEPSTWALLMGGIAVMAFLNRRRRA
jgi:hypothetical protein